jgi:hypothetical protein
MTQCLTDNWMRRNSLIDPLEKLIETFNLGGLADDSSARVLCGASL